MLNIHHTSKPFEAVTKTPFGISLAAVLPDRAARLSILFFDLLTGFQNNGGPARTCGGCSRLVFDQTHLFAGMGFLALHSGRLGIVGGIVGSFTR